MTTATKPKVSIVVPSYNRGEFIEATLKSIQEQTYEDFEVLFIDDGSTDDTQEIFDKKFSQDKRFIYIKQKNSERAVARTHGLEQAKADLLCLVDSDDLWYPHKLEKQVAVMDADPDLVFCYASVNRIDMEGNPVKSASRQHQGSSGFVFFDLLMRNFIPSVCPIFRKSAFEKVGAQVTEFIPYEDWDFWLRFSRLGKFHHIKEPLGDYRLHPGQSVQNVKAVHIERVTLKVLEANVQKLTKTDITNYLNMQGRTLNQVGFIETEYRDIIAEAYSMAYLRFAYWYLVSDKPDTCKRRLLESYKFSNKRLLDYRWYGLWAAYYLKPFFKESITKFLGSFH